MRYCAGAVELMFRGTYRSQSRELKLLRRQVAKNDRGQRRHRDSLRPLRTLRPVHAQHPHTPVHMRPIRTMAADVSVKFCVEAQAIVRFESGQRPPVHADDDRL